MKQPILLLTTTFVLTTTLHISISGKVSNMNSDHSDTQARDKASSAFSKIFIIGTDVATWFIFHPDDLVHRKDDPINWWDHDFAIRKELSTGTLVAVSTGGDGGYKIRVTDGSLTECERKYARHAKKFRLRVKHGRLYLDGGYALPSEMADDPEDFPNQWLEIPNGDYEVTVHVIDWSKEPGALTANDKVTDQALPSYVAVFKPVDDLQTISPPAYLPRLEPDYQSEMYQPLLASLSGPLKKEYPVLIRPTVVFPTIELALPITAAEWRQLNWLNRLPDTDFPSVVITHSFDPQAIGSLFRLSGFGTSLGLKPKSEYEMTGMGQRFVQLVKTSERGGMQWAEVKQYDIPPNSAQQAIIDKLKTHFAEYASKNTKYRERIPHPSFYAERVAALQEPLEILWAVANALVLSPEQARDLLNLSEQDLAEKLRQMLETKSK